MSNANFTASSFINQLNRRPECPHDVIIFVFTLFCEMLHLLWFSGRLMKLIYTPHPQVKAEIILVLLDKITRKEFKVSWDFIWKKNCVQPSTHFSFFAAEALLPSISNGEVSSCGMWNMSMSN